MFLKYYENFLCTSPTPLLQQSFFQWMLRYSSVVIIDRTFNSTTLTSHVLANFSILEVIAPTEISFRKEFLLPYFTIAGMLPLFTQSLSKIIILTHYETLNQLILNSGTLAIIFTTTALLKKADILDAPEEKAKISLFQLSFICTSTIVVQCIGQIFNINYWKAYLLFLTDTIRTIYREHHTSPICYNQMTHMVAATVMLSSTYLIDNVNKYDSNKHTNLILSNVLSVFFVTTLPTFLKRMLFSNARKENAIFNHLFQTSKISLAIGISAFAIVYNALPSPSLAAATFLALYTTLSFKKSDLTLPVFMIIGLMLIGHGLLYFADQSDYLKSSIFVNSLMTSIISTLYFFGGTLLPRELPRKTQKANPPSFFQLSVAPLLNRLPNPKETILSLIPKQQPTPP